MLNASEEKDSCPELAAGLHSFLTGRAASIEYSFDNMEVQVPRADENAPRAGWNAHGTVRLRTAEENRGDGGISLASK